ncbi:hypothetical protein Clacol_007616 [Clathrus columnatus]|uniref:Rab-GAP TBC domain-containing protein n=1 Tax=Clathrus columnatus TaxID=1419009 RepID=A0AAV5AFE3_9AGAM|nr:hypothetical protein Clacol_007616 [Clathrus columnatus]
MLFKFVKLLALVDAGVLVLAAPSAHDPCIKVAGKTFAAPADALACLRSFPFNETIRQNVISVVSGVFDFYTFEDYYLNSPPPFQESTSNIRAEIQRINTTSYETDFDFSKDLYQFTTMLNDGHTRWFPACYWSVYQNILPAPPVTLEVDGTQNVFVAPDSVEYLSQLGPDFLSFFKDLNFNWQRLAGAKVLAINGLNPYDYVDDIAHNTSGNYLDHGVRVNSVFSSYRLDDTNAYSQRLGDLAGPVFPEPDSVTFTVILVNHTEPETVVIPYITTFLGVPFTDGSSYWENNCAANNETNGVDLSTQGGSGLTPVPEISLPTRRMPRANVIDGSLKQAIALPTQFQPTVPIIAGESGTVKSYILPDNKTGVLFVGSFEGDETMFQQDTATAIEAFKAAGVTQMIVDITNNGGGFVCLGQWLHEFLAGSENVPVQPGFQSSMRANTLAQKIVQSDIARNVSSMEVFYPPSNWASLKNDVEFPNNFNYITPSLPSFINGESQPTSQRFFNIVFGGKPGEQLQYKGMAGNQVLEWADLDTEIKTGHVKNDPLAPPDLIINANMRVNWRIAYSFFDESKPIAYVSEPASIQFPYTLETYNNPQAVWEFVPDCWQKRDTSEIHDSAGNKQSGEDQISRPSYDYSFEKDDLVDTLTFDSRFFMNQLEIQPTEFEEGEDITQGSEEEGDIGDALDDASYGDLTNVSHENTGTEPIIQPAVMDTTMPSMTSGSPHSTRSEATPLTPPESHISPLTEKLKLQTTDIVPVRQDNSETDSSLVKASSFSTDSLSHDDSERRTNIIPGRLSVESHTTEDNETAAQVASSSQSPSNIHLSVSQRVISKTRPSHLPPKRKEEDQKHTKEWEEMMHRSRMAEHKRLKELQARRLSRELAIEASTLQWERTVLPDWKRAVKDPEIQKLWWKGVPPKLRSVVWEKVTGNSLALSKDAYSQCLSRAKSLMASRRFPTTALSLIESDISTTLPQLHIFHRQHGPLYEDLYNLLCAWVIARADEGLGYVEGIAKIGGMLLLNLNSPNQAFIVMRNLLERSCLRAFYGGHAARDDKRITVYFNFKQYQISPAEYLPDWLVPLFLNHLPIEACSRIWDVFLLEGDSFLFRASLSLLASVESRLFFPDREELLAVLKGESRAAVEVARRDPTSPLRMDENFIIPRYEIYGLSEEIVWERVMETAETWKESTWQRLLLRELPDA